MQSVIIFAERPPGSRGGMGDVAQQNEVPDISVPHEVRKSREILLTTNMITGGGGVCFALTCNVADGKWKKLKCWRLFQGNSMTEDETPAQDELSGLSSYFFICQTRLLKKTKHILILFLFDLFAFFGFASVQFCQQILSRKLTRIW